MSTKLITIVGATGKQGKAVIAAFQGNPAYRLRGITRNPDSDAAKALAQQNIEVVKADLDNLESVKAAFAGSHIIFAVTDFYEPFQKFGPAKAKEIEFTQGTNMAKAAAATPTLEHYIWSTLINGTKEYPVPHFESKYNVNKFIESDAALLAKSTFLVVCFYADNLALSSFRPQWVETAKKYVQFTTYPPETPIQFIGEVTKNVTPFVKAIVEKADETKNGTVVVGSLGTTTSQEWLDLWAKANNVEAHQVRVSRELYDTIWPHPSWAEEFALMMDFFEHVPVQEWLDPKQKVMTAEHLGIGAELETMEQWAQTYKLPEL